MNIYNKRYYLLSFSLWPGLVMLFKSSHILWNVMRLQRLITGPINYQESCFNYWMLYSGGHQVPAYIVSINTTIFKPTEPENYIVTSADKNLWRVSGGIILSYSYSYLLYEAVQALNLLLMWIRRVFHKCQMPGLVWFPPETRINWSPCWDPVHWPWHSGPHNLLSQWPCHDFFRKLTFSECVTAQTLPETDYGKKPSQQYTQAYSWVVLHGTITDQKSMRRDLSVWISALMWWLVLKNRHDRFSHIWQGTIINSHTYTCTILN